MKTRSITGEGTAHWINRGRMTSRDDEDGIGQAVATTRSKQQQEEREAQPMSAMGSVGCTTVKCLGHHSRHCHRPLCMTSAAISPDSLTSPSHTPSKFVPSLHATEHWTWPTLTRTEHLGIEGVLCRSTKYSHIVQYSNMLRIRDSHIRAILHTWPRAVRTNDLRATSHTRLRTCDHCTSGTLIDRKRRSRCKFASRYVRRTNGASECKMDVKST